MTYIAASAYRNLKQAFEENNLCLRAHADHMVAEGTQSPTKEKIQFIVESAGFCPLISASKIDNRNFAFTISPFKIPDFFNQKAAETIVEKQNYLNSNELVQLLISKKFEGTASAQIEDRWDSVNSFRRFIKPALNKGLSELVSRYAIAEHPIIEIGSGVGYSLLGLPNIIRTQPDVGDCQLLSQSGPLYQTDIQGIHGALAESGRKISLFFALNVFDTLSPELRKASFEQLSELQNPGDRILIMLDTNPFLNATIEHLERLYPEHAIFPYFPLSNDPAKFSVIVVPMEYIEVKPSVQQLVELIRQESSAKMKGGVSRMQLELHSLQAAYNLKVICFEDFFVEQVKKELTEVGYKSQSYYHHAFVCGELPPMSMTVRQDLLYKSVTDLLSVRQWSLDDEKFLASLSEKGLDCPNFTKETLATLRSTNQKIMGAQVLVVVATKS